MADPTLKDVLKVIAEMRAEVATKGDLARVEKNLKADVAEVRRDMDARFDRVDEQLADLDQDLTDHMKVHRQIEKDIEALKRRPARTAARAPRRPR